MSINPRKNSGRCALICPVLLLAAMPILADDATGNLTGQAMFQHPRGPSRLRVTGAEIPNLQTDLALSFSANLTNAGGSRTLTGFEATCQTAGCNSQVGAPPEPGPAARSAEIEFKPSKLLDRF
jgi:hypothetical protein